MSAVSARDNALTKNFENITSGITLATKAARGKSMNSMMDTKLSGTLASGKKTMTAILRNGFSFFTIP